MPRRIGRRELAIGGLGAAAIAVALIALDDGDGGGAEAQGPRTPTVSLERRDLTSRNSVDGTLGYAGSAAAISRLSGTFTWLPAEGDVIGRGEKLFEVDGDPAILMSGDIPAYRDLSEGVSDGADIKELEENLDALGFDPGTVDDEFTSSTASAVADWQGSLGLDATGTVELGRVVFMSGARRVTSLSVSLGSSSSSTGNGSSPSGSDTPASSDEAAEPTVMLASNAVPTAPAKTKPGASAKTGKRPSAKKPSGQGSTPSTPSSTPSASADSSGSDDSSASDGSTSPSTEVMTTSSERRIVTVDVDPSDLVKRGTAARIELPDGKNVDGRVASVGTVASSDDQSGQDSSSSPTIQITITLPEGAHVTGLDQAPVTVELTDEVRRNVFVVPIEALLGTAGGGYAIEVDGTNGRHQLPVDPGLFAAGYVEVSGDGLREGMSVEVPGE
jgi:peptidoglycan hydrolase-like protein with peptidoglycan-binding domain